MKKLWMKFAHAVGWLNTRILLTLVYLIVIAIPALVLRLLRKDPLERKPDPSAPSYWVAKQTTAHTLEQARHQF